MLTQQADGQDNLLPPIYALACGLSIVRTDGSFRGGHGSAIHPVRNVGADKT